MFPQVQAGHILWSINGHKVRSVGQAIKLLRNRMALRLVILDPSTLDDHVTNLASNTPTNEPSSEEKKDEDTDQIKIDSTTPTADATTIPSKSFVTVVGRSEDDDSKTYDDEMTLGEDDGDYDFAGDAEFETA